MITRKARSSVLVPESFLSTTWKFQSGEGSGNTKQENHRHASNTATSLNAEIAFSEVELLKRAMRFLDLAYLSKRRLVPET